MITDQSGDCQSLKLKLFIGKGTIEIMFIQGNFYFLNYPPFELQTLLLTPHLQVVWAKGFAPKLKNMILQRKSAIFFEERKKKSFSVWLEF